MSIVLRDFALHRLDVDQTATFTAIGALNPAALANNARDRLLSYVTNLEERSEFDGRAASAWWDGAGPPTVFSDLVACPSADFERGTTAAMQRLVDEAKGNASSGLVAFIRYDDGTPAASSALACFKLDLTELHDVQFQRNAPAASALVELDFADILPQASKLQKAALIPDPSGNHLRVVDVQAPAAAQYWMRFLGARANPGEKQRLREVVTAAHVELRETFKLQDPGPQVALAVARVVSQAKTFTPTDFVKEVAAVTAVDAAKLLTAVQLRNPRLQRPDFSITPDAAAAAKTTIDLGGGLKLSGPRGVVEERVEELFVNSSKYLKVLVTQGPTYTRT
jgi:hypothetical protein